MKQISEAVAEIHSNPEVFIHFHNGIYLKRLRNVLGDGVIILPFVD